MRWDWDPIGHLSLKIISNSKNASEELWNKILFYMHSNHYQLNIEIYQVFLICCFYLAFVGVFGVLINSAVIFLYCRHEKVFFVHSYSYLDIWRRECSKLNISASDRLQQTVAKSQHFWVGNILVWNSCRLYCSLSVWMETGRTVLCLHRMVSNIFR